MKQKEEEQNFVQHHHSYAYPHLHATNFPPHQDRAVQNGYKERKPEREPMCTQCENSTNDSVSIAETQLQADKVVSQASGNELSVLVMVGRVLSVRRLL